MSASPGLEVFGVCCGMALLLRHLLADEGGQDLVEYALLTTVVGLAAIAVFDALRAAIGNTYGSWETEVNNLWVPPEPSGSSTRAMDFTHAAALVVALLGCVTDLTTRRIPNVLTLGAAAGAFGYYLVGGGWPALVWSAGGWMIGGLLFLPLFALRGLGGGDVKLLAALGAWMGPLAVIWIALWGAIIGGMLAMAVALGSGYLGQALKNVWGLLMFWRVAGLRPHPALTVDSAGTVRMPYAVPIAAGLMVTLWLR